MSADPTLTRARRAATKTLRIDRVTAEVVAALEDAGAGALVLKGPGFRELLYGSEAPRSYGDTDLLVEAQHERRAEQVLAKLGFRASPGVGRPDPGVAQNHIWCREEYVVELHVTLLGIHAPPPHVWDAFAAGAGELRIGGRPIRVPGRTAQLLHAVLHAAQHGQASAKPLEDLRRALDRFDRPDWAAAAELAVRLDADGAFYAGLQLVPGGPELAARLHLAGRPDRVEALRAASASPLAGGIERMLRRGSLKARLVAIVRAFFPTVGFMRWWSPLARRGPVGLALAYPWRFVYVLFNFPTAIREWRRADADSRG